MLVYVNQKSIGRNKKIKTVPLEYDKVPTTISELIEETVKIMVDDFITRKETIKESPLTSEQIEDLKEIGKISFGFIYNDKMPDLDKSIETALLAYFDGLVCIFINDEIQDFRPEKVEDLKDCKIELKENDTITFVRLAMLAGRMW
ncbi:MAG: hypothetical protein J6U54_06800 [Clostridiales bacterium]|nr:hypothetical protein [Clostridiales bacterium]